MIKAYLAVFIFSFFLMACSTEKVNFSPLSDNISNDVLVVEEMGSKTETLVYQSDVTNLLASFPTFKNDAVDREISKLKESVSGYVRAISIDNEKKQEDYHEDFVNSYKKIQKLRKYLGKDQDEVLNRYLVRLKTNINLLESLN